MRQASFTLWKSTCPFADDRPVYYFSWVYFVLISHCCFPLVFFTVRTEGRGLKHRARDFSRTGSLNVMPQGWKIPLFMVSLLSYKPVHHRLLMITYHYQLYLTFSIWWNKTYNSGRPNLTKAIIWNPLGKHFLL